MLEQSARYVCTLDVVALYPSIPKEQALLAVDHALSLAGIDDAKKTFVAIYRKRYLDDIFMAWKGTSRQFDLFVGALNSAGLPFGIQFTGSCAKKIEYLDTEFRRAVLVCSDPSDRAAAIEYMQDKYLKCGYKEEDLNQAKSLALALDRGVILGLIV
ncbi:hypothetical protein ACHWQZ_G005249 [Mnemiopsis leidyi]